MKFDRSTINYKHLLLGILLNALVIVVFLMIYHAYIVAPNLETKTPPITPMEEIKLP